MTTNLYNGFSTTTTRGPDTAVHDIKCVNADILNVFNTPLRSRVGRASFGSIIPSLLFDLGDPTTQNQIAMDVQRNIDADPRVSLQQAVINVNLDQYSVLLQLLLNYIELNTSAWVSIPISAIS